MSNIAQKFFHTFKPHKVFSPVISREDLQLLKDFSKKSNIIVSPPDKGNGVVVLDKSTYISSMMNIVGDATKFKLISEPIEGLCRKVEGKINRFLYGIKDKRVINDDTYQKLRSTGSGPGVMYGQPKTHKIDFSTKFQCRPIMAAYNLASYKIAKFIVPILSPFTTNQYTILNSTEFSHKISSIPNADQLYMASFDIDSLFTNIPLHETIGICLQKLFSDPGVSTVFGFTDKLFKTLLEHAVFNSFFLFNDNYYQQIEGMGMGSPLGPTFANVFMCFHESNWLIDCPPEFKPLHYFRYLDDTFLLFKEKSHSDSFFSYLNSQHPSINFTIELEKDDKLPFLDVMIRRHGNSFSNSVFRKPTFTGLGTSFFSHSCQSFKVNGIHTLLHRAFNVCSTSFSFQREVSFLKDFFHNNGFPLKLIENQVENFLSKKLDFHQLTLTVPKKPLYLVFPYFGHKSVLFVKALSNLISENFPHIDPKLILVNNSKIGTFFKIKDALPKSLQSSLVYRFRCPQGNCGSAYVGSTVRTLVTRVMEHRGVSIFTGLPLNPCSLKQSSVRSHSDSCGNLVSLDDFEVLGHQKHDVDLRILESLYILKTKPNLNEMNSAFPLKLVY